MEIYYLKSIRKDGEMNKINKLMKFKLWDIDNIESEIYYKNLDDPSEIIKLAGNFYGLKIIYSNVKNDKINLKSTNEKFVYEVTDSEYMKEYKQRSADMFSKVNIKHYIIYSEYEVVEFLVEDNSFSVESFTKPK